MQAVLLPGKLIVEAKFLVSVRECHSGSALKEIIGGYVVINSVPEREHRAFS